MPQLAAHSAGKEKGGLRRPLKTENYGKLKTES
jgi:hypothetical protein